LGAEKAIGKDLIIKKMITTGGMKMEAMMDILQAGTKSMNEVIKMQKREGSN
jgi:hypothetical protein